MPSTLAMTTGTIDYDEPGAHHAHGSDADAGLRGAAGGAHAREHERGDGTHEPEKGRHPIAVGGLRARRAQGDDGPEEGEPAEDCMPIPAWQRRESSVCRSARASLKTSVDLSQVQTMA